METHKMTKLYYFCGLILAIIIPKSLCAEAEFQCYFGTPSVAKLPLKPHECEPHKTHTNETDTTKKYCMIYKYIQDSDVKADFWCDNDDLCENRTPGITSFDVKYKGHSGDLFCCDSSLCNVEKELQKMPLAPTVQCYNGSISVSQKRNFTIDSLKSDACRKGMCINVTTATITGYESHKYDYKFNCDQENLCQDYKVKDGHCENITRDGMTKLICCCSKNDCNAVESTDIPEATTVAHMSTVMGNPTLKQDRKWTFYGSIVGGVMLCILLFIGGGITFKKWKQRRDEQVAEYTYRQLTSDLAEDPSSDDFDDALLSDV